MSVATSLAEIIPAFQQTHTRSSWTTSFVFVGVHCSWAWQFTQAHKGLSPHYSSAKRSSSPHVASSFLWFLRCLYTDHALCQSRHNLQGLCWVLLVVVEQRPEENTASCSVWLEASLLPPSPPALPLLLLLLLPFPASRTSRVLGQGDASTRSSLAAVAEWLCGRKTGCPPGIGSDDGRCAAPPWEGEGGDDPLAVRCVPRLRPTTTITTISRTQRLVIITAAAASQQYPISFCPSSFLTSTTSPPHPLPPHRPPPPHPPTQKQTMAEEGAATIEDYDFSGTTAGASDVFPSEAGQIKKGGYIMIKDRPCKVVNVSTSKTGKHGHAKANFTAIDIFNGKKVEDVVPTTHTTYVPNVNRSEYQLLDIEDGFLSLLTEGGDTRDDLKLPDYPEGFDQEILKAFKDGKSLSISVLSACGIDQVIAYKVGEGGREGGREGGLLVEARFLCGVSVQT